MIEMKEMEIPEYPYPRDQRISLKAVLATLVILIKENKQRIQSIGRYNTHTKPARESYKNEGSIFALRNMNIYKLKPEVRAINIALGFLRGKPYAKIEDKAVTWPDWDVVYGYVVHYGMPYRKLARYKKQHNYLEREQQKALLVSRFENWKTTAQDHILQNRISREERLRLSAEAKEDPVKESLEKEKEKV